MRPKKILLAVIALCVITLSPLGTLAQQGTDCRRKLPPPDKGAIDLTGEWMDNSVNLKVHIIQLGSNLHGIGDVTAAYRAPYKCAYPASTGSGGSTPTDVILYTDFTGHLKNKVIEGEVYICQSQTRGKINDETATPGTFIPHLENYSEVVTGPLKNMTVSEDGNSISGTFDDPSKGNLPIRFTRLSSPEKSQYYPAGLLWTTAATKIYPDSSTNSTVKYSVSPGTKLVFEVEHLKLDAAGNPAWYYVLQLSPDVAGWIPAASVTCSNPNKGPGEAD